MKRRDWISALVVFCLFGVIFGRGGCGGVSVGDKPQLSFTSSDGEQVDLAALKGKMVLIDFWASWCGPCMAEANHMVQINDAYHDKGLQIIGINLDQERSSMDAAIQQTGFDWPQYFDGKGWSNDIVRKWRVDSIPRTFLIGPDGDVLWTGHPAEIDGALKDAFANHPPRETE